MSLAAFVAVHGLIAGGQGTLGKKQLQPFADLVEGETAVPGTGKAALLEKSKYKLLCQRPLSATVLFCLYISTMLQQP